MDDDMDMGSSVFMTFSGLGVYKVTILWDWWDVQTPWQYALSCAAVVALALAYHYVRRAEMRLLREMAGKAVQDANTPSEDASLLQSPLGVLQRPTAGTLRKQRAQRLHLAILSCLGYAMALLMMLIAMTYNSGLFITLLAGWALGAYVFYDGALPVVRVEHCH